MASGREGYARLLGGSDMPPRVQVQREVWGECQAKFDSHIIPNSKNKLNKNSILTAEPNRKSYLEQARRTITDELIDLASSPFVAGLRESSCNKRQPSPVLPKHPVGNGRRRQQSLSQARNIGVCHMRNT